MRHRVQEDYFHELMSKIKASYSGEPGIYLTNDKDWGTNPCCEIALRPYQFCNLCEVNVSNIENQQDLNDRVTMATILGTLQATYTDFHYIREVWKRTTERDALVGISMTGIASNRLNGLDLIKAANIVKEVNKEWASLLGINSAARTTCVKPAGTTSCVLGTSSGIHAWYGEYYVRRIQISKSEAIYPYLQEKIPELVEDYRAKHGMGIVSIPQKIPYGDSTVRSDESAIMMLERIKTMSNTWVKTGHVTGNNTHNVSATVYIQDFEWKKVAKWLWDNRDSYNGISLLPYDGGIYEQTPFEEITEAQYHEMSKHLNSIDLSEVKEEEDTTNLQGELACAGGVSEI